MECSHEEQKTLVSVYISLISLVLIFGKLALILVGLVHPARSKDGNREVVFSDQFQRLQEHDGS